MALLCNVNSKKKFTAAQFNPFTDTKEVTANRGCIDAYLDRIGGDNGNSRDSVD